MKQPRLSFLVLAVGVLLAGCRTALPAPPAPVTPRWESGSPISEKPRVSEKPRAAEDESTIRSSAESTLPLNGLWTLENCVNRALVASRGILDAEAALLSAEYSIAAAESGFELKIFPNASATTTSGPGASDQVGAGIDFVQRTRSGADWSVSPTLQRTSGTYTAGYVAGITQPLLRGRQRELVEASIDSAEYLGRATRRGLYLSQVNTTLATISGVMDVVRLRETLRLNEESAERSESHVRAARARERAGLSNSLDVVRATQQFNRSSDALNTAREAYGDALDSLRLLLALPLDAPFVVDAPLVVEDLEIEAGAALNLALRNRVEILQAADDLDESMRRSRVADIETQPDLDLVLSLAQFGSGASVDQGLELGGPSLTVGLASSSDLWRTAERARLAQAKISVAVVRRRMELQHDQVVREVRRAQRDLDRDTQRIALQEAQVDQATGKLRVARIKFERGVASNFDVIEAEEELRSAQTSLIAAVAATIVDGYALRAAVGTLVERPLNF